MHDDHSVYHLKCHRMLVDEHCSDEKMTLPRLREKAPSKANGGEKMLEINGLPTEREKES